MNEFKTGDQVECWDEVNKEKSAGYYLAFFHDMHWVIDPGMAEAFPWDFCNKIDEDDVLD